VSSTQSSSPDFMGRKRGRNAASSHKRENEADLQRRGSGATPLKKERAKEVHVPRKKQNTGTGVSTAREGTQKTKSGMRKGEHVTPREHDEIVRLLRKIAWDQVVNTSRRNILGPEAPKKDGKKYCKSLILGGNMKSVDRRPSWFTEQNPELFEALSKLMQKHDPDHVWTNITINQNTLCAVHRDRGNEGPSYIVGFGDYTGGELNLGERDPAGRFPPNEKPPKFTTVNLKKRFVKFWGGEQTHWTCPFEGERYTCVFYNFPNVHAKARVDEDPESEPAMQVPAALASKLAKFKQRIRKNRR